MYIEELIQFVTSTGQHLFNRFPTSSLGLNDYKILSSIAERLYYNQDRLTEKQAGLIIKLLKKNRDVIRPHVPAIDDHIDNPQWQHPFRIIPTVKKISIKKDGNTFIVAEFPFDQEVVEAFRKRNQEVHPVHAGAWNSEEKKWHFRLTETNINWLGNFLLSRDFEASDDFLKLFADVNGVINNFETYLPMLVQTDTGFEIKNAHAKVPQPNTTNLAEALFWARDYGITSWDDKIDNRINTELSTVVRRVLSSGLERPWFNSEEVDIDKFAELVKFGGPILVIIPGGSELESIIKWVEFVMSQGIRQDQMSVMFRLPNEQATFNSYVKQMNLNNPVDENTRVVFVSTKITKPLVKSGVKFKTVINLGYYNYLHFTMSAAVDNAQNLVYYSMKQPNNYKNKWQQHEL